MQYFRKKYLYQTKLIDFYRTNYAATLFSYPVSYQEFLQCGGWYLSCKFFTLDFAAISNFEYLGTAKRILERLHHRLSKFDKSVFLNLKPISYFFGIYMACFLSRNYWSSLDHDLMASI